MQIGLISDTHGFLDPKVFEYFENCDQIWHAGDIGKLSLADELEDFKPFKAVYGNIDGQDIRQVYPLDQKFEVEGLRIWMTHIGGSPPRYNKRIRETLMDEKYDLFICGHSHILKIVTDPKNKLTYLNPGAAGRQGFHKIKTLIRFNLEEKKLTQLQVIEMGKRG